MPNRILKETIKASAQIDALSWFEEVLFYRLMVSADDYGCMDGRVVLLKNELFPLKDNVTKKAVEDAVSHLVSVGLLRRYEVNGMPYLLFPTWEKHQRVRNQHRKFPEPSEQAFLDARQQSAVVCQQSAVNCQSNDGQLTASCQSESESNQNPIRIQTESNPTRARGPQSDRVPTQLEIQFAHFWEAYPKKVGKKDAFAAFRKVSVPVEDLIEAVERQKLSKQWQIEGGRFIPNPATWLNQGRWDDELPPGGDAGVQQHGAPMSSDMRAAVARMMAREDLDDG